MIKAAIKGIMVSFAILGTAAFLYYLRHLVVLKKSDEESFWESHVFEDSLEQADDLCEVGYTFKLDGTTYRKISGKKWFVEISDPDGGIFKPGFELEIDGYLYTKINEKVWTIEKI